MAEINGSQKFTTWPKTESYYSYSVVPNKQVGWNKGVGKKKIWKLIKELDWINKLVGKAKNELVGNIKIFKTFSNYQGLESFLKYSNHQK